MFKISDVLSREWENDMFLQYFLKKKDKSEMLNIKNNRCVFLYTWLKFVMKFTTVGYYQMEKKEKTDNSVKMTLIFK